MFLLWSFINKKKQQLRRRTILQNLTYNMSMHVCIYFSLLIDMFGTRYGVRLIGHSRSVHDGKTRTVYTLDPSPPLENRIRNETLSVNREKTWKYPKRKNGIRRKRRSDIFLKSCRTTIPNRRPSRAGRKFRTLSMAKPFMGARGNRVCDDLSIHHADPRRTCTSHEEC